MTATSVPTADKILSDATILQIRPRYEGSNICTWIGFKHVNYLVEEAVLEHFRRGGLTARSLYEDHGLCLDLVEIDTRILHAFHMDDLATAEVVHATSPQDYELTFTITIHIDCNGRSLKAATSKVRVVLRVDERGSQAEPVVEELARFTVRRIERPGANAAPAAVDGARANLSPGPDTTSPDPVLDQLTQGQNAFCWKWRIPYFYCHFTERLQMSGYLRLIEEVVDLFLADRGISIKTLLDNQNWIPVVPHSAISMVDEALMEEDLYTVFTVEDTFKDFTYTARIDCYVLRDGTLRRTATGYITHGYAVIDNRRDWSLVNFDDRVLRALQGSAASARTARCRTFVSSEEGSWNGC